MGKVVTLGEIMLRLSTEVGKRINQADKYVAQFGGSEANVAISLANYGHEAYFVSKVPKNALGEGVQKHLLQYGVKHDFLLTGGNRLGTYYMESGIGERAASIIYDRAGSSFATLADIVWDVEELFHGVDIFHISGITPALSKQWENNTIKLIKKAKDKGCKISFDINYRERLWTKEQAAQSIQRILPFVDYCSAGKLDAIYLLGVSEAEHKEEDFIYYYQQIHNKYPNLSVIYSTKRKVISASSNTLTGTVWMNQACYQSQTHVLEPIVDRVGAGDAFSGAVLHGIMQSKQPQELINFATAASALKHTVHGDCNQFSEQEVNQFLQTASGKIIR